MNSKFQQVLPYLIALAIFLAGASMGGIIGYLIWAPQQTIQASAANPLVYVVMTATPAQETATPASGPEAFATPTEALPLLSPTPTAGGTPTTGGTPTPRVYYISAALAANLRDAPAGNVVTALPNGTQVVEVLPSERVEANGYTWVHVIVPDKDDLGGWIAENLLR